MCQKNVFGFHITQLSEGVAEGATPDPAPAPAPAPAPDDVAEEAVLVWGTVGMSVLPTCFSRKRSIASICGLFTNPGA